jgi:2-oxoisovalerate dehydrogenase E1 component
MTSTPQRINVAAVLPDASLSESFFVYRAEFLKALLIRRVEQALLELFAAGELNGTVHTCVGQELVPAMLVRHLTPADYFTSNHRGHGHFLVAGGEPASLLAEVMGRVAGAAGGYGGSQHLVLRRFFSNGVQGGMTPVACGLANVGGDEGAVCVSFIGDGTMGTGQLYEALNLASAWRLPVVYVVEDNGIAQSTDQRQTLAGTIRDRARAFGIEAYESDVWDLQGLDAACAAAVARARGGLPALLHIRVARLNSHSKGDDNRSDEAIAALREKDLLNRAEQAGLFDADDLRSLGAEVERAVQAARSTPKLIDVPRFCPAVVSDRRDFKPLAMGARDKFITALQGALAALLAQDPLLMLVGQDIEDLTPFTSKFYGGAFKATKGLSSDFPGRVRNSPISEGAIVGFAAGRSLAGRRTVVEIMFGDFCTLIVDQIVQHASKFSQMFGGREFPAFMVRTPMGGRRGYGPTHSQSLERLFMGLQGLLLLSPNHRIDPERLYRRALFDRDTPVLIAEHKLLYNCAMHPPPPRGYVAEADDAIFPTVRLRPVRHAPNCTILTYGYGLVLAEQALAILAMEHEVFVEIVCPTSLTPFDLRATLDSVRRTGRLVTLEEGGSIGSLGGEAIAQCALNGVPLKAVRRLANDTTIPCALQAELALLPSVHDIVTAVVETL